MRNNTYISRRNTKRGRNEISDLFFYPTRLYLMECTAHLRDYSNTLSAKFLVIYPEGDCPTGIDAGDLRSNGLAVFGENVLPANDNDILHATNYIKFLKRKKSKIAC